MNVNDAIRKRRAVRTYTDEPVSDEVLDRLLRLSLSAPTGSGAQAWGMVVVRDEEKRLGVAELIISGGAQYFATMRHRKDEVSEQEHAQWGRDYAEKILGTYRKVPVWIVGTLVPRGNYPASMESGGRDDDLISLAFAMENLFLSARAEGLGTVPTTAFQRFEMDGLTSLLGLPAEVTPEIVTPLGHPEAFPEGKPPALKNTFRSWKTLVHDDSWGAVRESAEG
jgi:nitroreductase